MKLRIKKETTLFMAGALTAVGSLWWADNILTAIYLIADKEFPQPDWANVWTGIAGATVILALAWSLNRRGRRMKRHTPEQKAQPQRTSPCQRWNQALP